MTKIATLVIFFLCLLGGYSIPVQAQCQAADNPKASSGKGKKSIFIRGEEVGFVSVSPALRKKIEEKTGNKPDPDPGAMGPNAEVTSTGFTYVSPSAKGKAKAKNK